MKRSTRPVLPTRICTSTILRGTAATKFYIAGLPIGVIAEILAWSEDQVERIIRRYVARAAATKAAIAQLNQARKEREL
jgi:integrase